MGLLKSIRDYVDTLVHPSAQRDALTASRHRAFIAPRLLGSIAALAALPIYVTLRGAPGSLEVLVFAWLVLPMLTAYYLSRTGHYESAHVLSSLALTGLVTAVAAGTGGIGSFAAIWLVLVPLEASLSASRRVVAIASTFTLAAVALLHFLGRADMLPPPDASGAGALAALGVVSAVLYAIGLALGAESLARTSFWLLYAEEDRYRLLARNMTDVITRHGRNGAVLFASPAAETLFGAKVTELHGHRLFDRVHVADRPAYLTALADAASLGEAQSVEFRVRRDVQDSAPPVAGNEFVWVEMRCRKLDNTSTGAKPSEPEVVAVMRDVTERKNQEQALERIRAEADHANEAKDKFLANMSHELRTPLNAIIGFSDMLINEERMRLDGPRRQEYAKLINDSGNHLLTVVNGILDMSKLETGDFELAPEPFGPAQVIGNCCDLLALKARENGIELSRRLPDSLPELIADKRSFKQILLNLISNAVKFTERGGRVTVSATAGISEIVVTVADTGVGISAEDLPKIGRPFFQARGTYDRRHDGTGLGLSIVRGLIDLHGGSFEIASEVGKGTCLTVRLPWNCETARPAAKQSAQAPSNIERPAFDRPASAPEMPMKKTA
ncbi:sensor histidine kinase [Rhodoplanes sp. Z2-YC6860]|uniref:sensor histidine kinase n=1 Tax=Rhodoplanes sp. Z2-YC6860 TaxID=674703 RepID=UPI00078D7DF5|nr:PAS domain-containing sensor histidine kinase [Rhodoplanes sp. Z2-YC6860]AMN41352.1 Two-component sensor histidine kinase [Rhodoplanes sp. Z2-YC6860]